MPPITKTETHQAGYTCDFCGKIISDGKHNGLGGINFWGHGLSISKMEEEEVVIKRVWDGYCIKINSPMDVDRESWGLCSDCIKKVKDFIIKNLGDKK